MATMTAEIPVELPDDEVDCGSCVTRLRDELALHGGLIEVEVAGRSTIRVAYDPDDCSIDCVTRAADAIGANLARRFHHEILRVEGMDCYDCAQTIEAAVNRVDGVTGCSVNFAAARMRVEYETGPDTLDRVQRQVVALGYRVPRGTTAEEQQPSFFARRRDEMSTGVSALLTVAAFALSVAGIDGVAIAPYVAAIVIGGWPVARSGMAALRATRRPDINLLMTIAVIGAAAIGAWLEAALVVVLFSVGEALEAYAVARARRSLGDLLTLAPEIAHLVRDGHEDDVPAATLAPGNRIAVRPGERIPADGSVSEGESSVDQAAITGESIPADKRAGDDVYAGTLNGEGRLIVTVERASGDTTLDRIARAVEEAQARKAPAERWVDAFARVYTPIVMAVAVLTAVVPPLLGLGDVGSWVYRGLAFLILACPCALVIATPVSIVSALARASAAGVLVKGGAHLEAAAGIQAVAFDKTGTLTVGRPHVTKVVRIGAHTDAQLLRLAASLEAASEHPLARGIVDEAQRWNIELAPVTDFSVERGAGVIGTVEGFRLRAGKPDMFDGHPAMESARPAIDKLRREGRTVIVVGDDQRLAGLVGINDTVRKNARDALESLRAVGVQTTVLLTGDHEQAAGAVAHETAVDAFESSLLPEEKVRSVEALHERYQVVAMVGDGVNDAPALAVADVGIAMGTAGSPTAIETADIALMGDDLTKVAKLIGLSRWTRVVVRQNIMFSLVVKAIAAVLAVAGMLTLWMAVLADVGATLLVVANGLRLLRARPSGGLRSLPLLDPKAVP